MRPGKVIEAFPFGEFRFEIDVILVCEELVELLLVRAMLALDLAVELGRSRFDVDMADAEVLDMPMKLGLELVAAVGADYLDPEGELL